MLGVGEEEIPQAAGLRLGLELLDHRRDHPAVLGGAGHQVAQEWLLDGLHLVGEEPVELVMSSWARGE